MLSLVTLSLSSLLFCHGSNYLATDATKNIIINKYSFTISTDKYEYTQKQPSCKKGIALFKIASVKKVVKSKGAAKKWL